jgi:hypothetical protein
MSDKYLKGEERAASIRGLSKEFADQLPELETKHRRGHVVGPLRRTAPAFHEKRLSGVEVSGASAEIRSMVNVNGTE